MVTIKYATKIFAMTNPFKFGSVVDDPFFSDREEEMKRIISFFGSENHLTLISPRRFGKTSLVKRAVRVARVKSIYLDMQIGRASCRVRV